MTYLKSNLDLNTITVKRTALTWDEAIAVWVMRRNGDAQHHIAARLGTNSARVADVLTEKSHIGSRDASSSFQLN
ncbi:hypothetical protein KUW14_00340 [Pseudooceanicola nitratireducens]|uniref:hypothetical protein n=1 Tax=Pseudooceanicola nitratireducens TaxID=517719 RepID=UPI001C9519EE|nr:hypothetical protein [Pseudooceanicola nitratireducens]MBY6164276.1 hypothetical protein [Pseudooceanicola nitratireducens]